MTFREVINLVGETPAAHGVFDNYTPSSRQVFCTVRSVGMNEAYQAMSNGLHPQFVFSLSDYADYEGEKIVLYNNAKYRVIRAYRNNQSIELTCEESTVDAREVTNNA